MSHTFERIVEKYWWQRCRFVSRYPKPEVMMGLILVEVAPNKSRKVRH
jgi:hypothetical protein